MSSGGRWSDLTTRLVSGLVMVLVGLTAVVLGGPVFSVFLALICGAMVWELVRMLLPDQRAPALMLGGGSGAALLVAVYVPGVFVLPLLLAPLLAGAGYLRQYRALLVLYGGLILLAGYAMMVERSAFGLVWILWLILVVIVTDVAGYFAGKSLGGPKLWPRVSPNKTWSGTLAGWIGAGLAGGLFALLLGTGAGIVALSILASMASQLGDIAESAIKRRMGVKDSSALIPGHGGLLDRFDGMLAASVFVFIAGSLTGFALGAQ